MSKGTIDDLMVKVAEINRKAKTQKLTDGAGFHMKRIPTGIPSLDEGVGGGMPMGRFVLLWGEKSGGKTTASLMTIAEAQKQGMKCLYVNSEGAYDTAWAEIHGVNTQELLVLREHTIEGLLEVCLPLIQEEMIDVLVIDSINGIRFDNYYDIDDPKNTIGNHARGIQEVLNKFNKYNKDTLIILISQVRTKMTQYTQFLGPTGGNSVGFFASLSVKFTVDKNLVQESKDDKNTVYAKWINWEVDKTRVSVPFRTGRFQFYTQTGGINYTEQIVTLGLQMGIVEKSGNWFLIDGIKLNGMTAFQDYLIDNAKSYSELKDEVLKRIYE